MSALPICDKLRRTWPKNDGFGPRTCAQRHLANEAADTIEALYEAARLFVEEYDSGDQDDGVALMLAYNRALEAAKAAIARARGEHSLTQSDPLNSIER